MKREIKFRAWDELNKCMIYPRKQHLTKHFLSSGEILQRYGTVMQYTGLKDKNGKEIYEGDIVAFNDDRKYNAEIVWNEKKAKFIITKGGYSIISIDIEVIGNIYENPELL